MIVNENYLQDIDDEDDDVVSSGNNMTNAETYEFDIKLEYGREISIWGYIPGGGLPDKLPGFSTDDFLDYKEHLEDILDTLHLVRDYDIRMWTELQYPFDTDKMNEYDTIEFDEREIEIPFVRVKFNTTVVPTYKQFYEVVQRLCISYTDFIDKFDYHKNDSNFRDCYQAVTVNGLFISGFRNIAYQLKSHFNAIVGFNNEIEIPKTKEFHYIGYSNHLSDLSEKGIDEFVFGDVLYSTKSGDLVSQAKNADGSKNTPIAICFRGHKGDHRFVSLNYMSRATPSTGQKHFSYDAEIPYGSCGVKLECKNAPEIMQYCGIQISSEKQLISGEQDTQKALAYMSSCYSSKSKRACEKDMYFSDCLPYENTKGLLQSFICVNRFHTKGTRPGDWYFPSAYEVFMFTNMLVHKDWVDDRFDDVEWKERKESGTGKPNGIFNIHAKELIDHVRKSIKYPPLQRGTIISSTETDKNNCNGANIKYGGMDRKVTKDAEAMVFACLRITDIDDAF